MQTPTTNEATLPTQETLIKEQLYCSLIRENLGAIAIVDEKLRFVTANAAFCSLLGIPGEDRLNCFHVSVLPFSKDPNFNSLLKGLVTNKIPRFESEAQFQTLNKETRFLKLKMVSVKEHGVFKGGTLFMEDITQLKERTLRLEKTITELKSKNQSQEKYISTGLQLENFAYLASHDMKEPLRMIGNFSQLLEKRYGHQLDDSGKEYLDFIVGGVKNMNLFIDDLLAYSKLDKEPHSIQPVRPDNLAFITVQSLRDELEEKNITVQYEKMPEVIYGSKTKIQRLFKHLISNALKFSNEEQESFIKISGSETETYWQFEVEDNGIGIQEPFFEKIFLLFKRLHLRNQYQGSGIGLALCKKIIDQHNGEIWVESEFGKGSKFIFTISKT